MWLLPELAIALDFFLTICFAVLNVTEKEGVICFPAMGCRFSKIDNRVRRIDCIATQVRLLKKGGAGRVGPLREEGRL